MWQNSNRDSENNERYSRRGLRAPGKCNFGEEVIVDEPVYECIYEYEGTDFKGNYSAPQMGMSCRYIETI